MYKIVVFFLYKTGILFQYPLPPPPQKKIFNMNIKGNFLCLFSHQTTIIQVLTTYM